MAQVLAARTILAAPDRWVEGGGLLVESGRIERVLVSRRAVLRAAREFGAPIEDQGDVTLTPGLVDAHAHLELSHLRGVLPRDEPFPRWIAALLEARRASSAEDLRLAARAGADRLLATGTTSVGDIDSSGAAERGLAHCPIRVRLYREALDLGLPERTSRVLGELARPFARRDRLHPGVSPHAPYTVGAELCASLGRFVRRRSWAVAIHWAETEEELEWLEHGTGAFGAILPARIAHAGSGLAAFAGAGLVGRRTALIHGNHPLERDREAVRAAGATLVHCPGAHAFFRREPFDLARWLELGVPVALGTDSLASNEDLDLRRELALLRASAPWLAPKDAWAMATVHGARALALPNRVGELRAGAWADLCAFATGESALDAQLEALSGGRGRVEAVWVAGRRVRAREALPDGSAAG